MTLPKLNSFPLIGSLHLIDLKRCLYAQLSQFSKNLGDAYGFKLLTKNIVVISNLELYKQVIVKDRDIFLKGSTLNEVKAINKGRASILDADGPQWQKLRGELSSFFTPANLEKLHPIVHSKMKLYVEMMDDKTTTDDLETLMGKIALSMTSEFFIGHQFQLSKKEFYDSSVSIDKFFYFQKFLIEELTKRMQFGPLYKYIPTISNIKFRKFTKEGKEFVRNIIQNHTGESAPLIPHLKALGLNDEEIIGHVYGLVGASFESTAVSLTWLLYFICQQGEQKQEELYQKLSEIDSNNTKAILDCELLDRYLSETLRLRPAFPMLFREACQDTSINSVSTGEVSIKKGSIVFALLGDILSNSQVWGDDHKGFRPERFVELSSEQRKAYIPYGMGTRMCLGREMATVEIKLIAHYLLTHFKISPACDFDQIAPKQKFVFSSDKKIKLTFTRR